MSEITPGIKMSVYRPQAEGKVDMRVDVERIAKNMVTLKVGDRTEVLMQGDSLVVSLPLTAIPKLDEQISSGQIEALLEKVVRKVVREEMPRMLIESQEWCDDCRQRQISCRCP